MPRLGNKSKDHKDKNSLEYSMASFEQDLKSLNTLINSYSNEGNKTKHRKMRGGGEHGEDSEELFMNGGSKHSNKNRFEDSFEERDRFENADSERYNERSKNRLKKASKNSKEREREREREQNRFEEQFASDEQFEEQEHEQDRLQSRFKNASKNKMNEREKNRMNNRYKEASEDAFDDRFDEQYKNASHEQFDDRFDDRFDDSFEDSMSGGKREKGAAIRNFKITFIGGKPVKHSGKYSCLADGGRPKEAAVRAFSKICAEMRDDKKDVNKFRFILRESTRGGNREKRWVYDGVEKKRGKAIKIKRKDGSEYEVNYDHKVYRVKSK